MDFNDIKSRFQAMLAAELGAEQPFRVVSQVDWTGPCPQGDQEHMEDIPRACFDCHQVYVPETTWAGFTDARIAASVEMIAERLDATSEGEEQAP